MVAEIEAPSTRSRGEFGAMGRSIGCGDGDCSNEDHKSLGCDGSLIFPAHVGLDGVDLRRVGADARFEWAKYARIALSAMRFTGEMSTGPGGVKPVEWTAKSTKVFKSADCGSVKPLAMPSK